jgi:hypothetical protein
MRHGTTPEKTRTFVSVCPETLAKTARTREGAGQIGFVSDFPHGGGAPLDGVFAPARECRERRASFDLVKQLLAVHIAPARIRPPASECLTNAPCAV